MKYPAQRQQGVALFTALVVMSLILLLGVTAAKFTIGNLKMAVNEEVRVSAIQGTQAIIDAAFLDGINTAVRGGDGVTTCTDRFPLPPAADTTCTYSDISLPDEFDDDISNERIAIRVSRGTPSLIPPPRGIGTSIRAFDAAPFLIEAQFDKRDVRQGYAEINEGVILLVPKY